MGLYEELAQNFPEEQTIFGSCLLVPHSAFKPEWNEQLAKEGVKVFQQSYNGRLFFFLKKANGNNETVDSKSTPTPSEQAKPKRFSWSKEDLERLRQMRMQGVSLDEIAKSLKRTRGSILGKLKTLKKAEPPKPLENEQTEAVNCEVDLVGELITALQLLYPKHKRIAKFILENSSNLLKDE